MGSDISLPVISQKPPNQGQIYDKTHDTVELMNHILQFILNNADIRDLIKLSTDAGCSKWIVVAETKLSDVFEKLRIQPDAGKDGMLYLKRLDDFKSKQKDLEEKGGKKHKQYCDVIAFFFIRLFQVVGALALSVIDSELPTKNYGETDVMSVSKERKGIPFFDTPPKTSFMERIKPKSWYGGALTGASMLSGKLNILNRYLDISPNDPTKYTLSEPSSGRQTESERRSTGYPGILYNITSNSIDIHYTYIDDNKDKKTVDFTMLFENGTNSRNLTANIITLNNVKKDNILLNNFIISHTYTVSPDSATDPGRITVFPSDSDTSKTMFLIEYLRASTRDIINTPISATLRNLKELNLLDIINKTIKHTNIDYDDGEPPKFRFEKQSVVKARSKIRFTFNLIVNNPSKDVYNLEMKQLRFDNPSGLDISSDINSSDDKNDSNNDDTNVKVILSNKISFNKKGSYFKDRYGNTINEFLLKQTNKIYNLAEKEIVEDAGKTTRGFLPALRNSDSQSDSLLKYTDLWKTLIQDPPVKSFCTSRALQLLNLSGLAQQIPDEIKPMVYAAKFPLYTNKSLPRPGEKITEAAPFKSLAMLYKPATDILDILKPNKSVLPTITVTDSEKRRTMNLAQLIKSFGANEDIKTIDQILEPNGSQPSLLNKTADAAKIATLRTQATKLFQRQFLHSKNVGKLLKKIFIIDSNITLNPSIMSKGIKGIEEIALEARELLTSYYSDCQTEYNIGVQALTSIKLNPAPATK